MTMFSDKNRRSCDGSGGGYVKDDFDVMNQLQGYCSSEDCNIGTLRAEDEPKDAGENKDEGWLRLSIGGEFSQKTNQDMAIDHNSRKYRPDLVELARSSNNSTYYSHSQDKSCGLITEFQAPRPLMNIATTPQHQEINWAARPMIPINYIAATSSFSCPIFSLMAPGPSIDHFKVIPSRKRPNSGIWFMLQASQYQEREPFLPQIPKSYLRIKDGGITIGLVIKYLVNKLTLENESKIEIRCKGQRLVSSLTLRHVRDNIWNPTPWDKSFITLLPNSSSTDHIMVLHYSTSS